MLRTSFTTVEASGNSVRQRDILPVPVPWSWAPFAEFLWQAVDERRHRSSHQERRRRRELPVWGAGPCWRSVSSIFCTLASATSKSCESVGENRGRRSSPLFGGLCVTRVGRTGS